MGEARRAFVTGWPVGHSRSPMIHEAWLSELGLAGSYEAVGVAPEDFRGFVEGIAANGWAGGNVTIPHKEAAFVLVDRRDEAAEAIGAVNTLWLDEGRLVGGNTDAYGFSANLDEGLSGWRDAGHAVVLGAGGAARAVVHALKAAGVRRIDVVNRSEARARALAESLGAGVEGHGLPREGELIGRAELLVNTRPSAGAGAGPDLSRARPDALATDIVYVPLKTPFLEAAQTRGLRTADGLGMLLHQAVPGFERWFGVRPAVGATLRSRIEADILRSA